MKILTINCGSSSIKYKLFDFPKGILICKGLIEKIAEKNSSIKTHTQGMRHVFATLKREGALKDFREIRAIGHRVVHGAETFVKPHVIDDKVIHKIKECSELAPLHNPVNLEGIQAVRKILPKVLQVAVFDTAFHQSMPAAAYMYAIPLKYYNNYKIRRYGFHGTSHQYVACAAAKVLKKPLGKLKLITCHLGNGCSIACVSKGKSVDTSMGFTPLEGLIMGTRSGDIDPAVIFYLMHKERLSYQKCDDILNRQSGLLGVSGISNDLRIIRKHVKRGNRRAQLAFDMFVHRIKKYIGAYLLVLGGADAVCFTAGIGENCLDIVSKLTKSIRKISKKTKVLIIPTDEEGMIAQHTYNVIQRRTKKK